MRRSRVAEGECLQRREGLGLGLGFEDLGLEEAGDDERVEEDDEGMVVVVMEEVVTNNRWRMLEKRNGVSLSFLFDKLFIYLFIFFRSIIIIIRGSVCVKICVWFEGKECTHVSARLLVVVVSLSTRSLQRLGLNLEEAFSTMQNIIFFSFFFFLFDFFCFDLFIHWIVSEF